uniref:Aminotransferase class I/classII large domain-containing protein n=1 Tax=Corethron hystrix TaxID=216773 RepID=A0A7S1FXY0_9STRA|mmetsp:Transcript_36205/g.84666  ORF Transcript_36205/g.84666 Transcript_36205/m.84666 type:complete len:443 (+) Transcript_36205:161-1489(+)|eukprot:CAMPEP_0113307572 /NCGR_PEP_ID=MMETSP0010_2-20120614/6366_1 /TAXON_ID=216773 ORGANISM="Corethron hystrix, Strain 308" /NCGR_SAMPLE_ID=MMETSP0010_2 /ASSEMBLY_ACC=CAM_ASM_000155 /LENGTH=442 /DNA_ID=CAMNT_0000162459 /DNA_START=160 /DNA_END=1488 /DNA_ORIENTATION=- /assembly_acc=CAM_ASM_000155
MKLSSSVLAFFCLSTAPGASAFFTPTTRKSSSSLQMSGVTRNENFGKLAGGYLFPEIGRRRNAFLEKNPDAKIISLGIGDTTQPIPPAILSGLVDGAKKLGEAQTYSGYGAEQGRGDLRAKIAEVLYGNKISADEVFVSDGAKCDIARLQLMFGQGVRSAVQDPSYPVYVDTSVMMGQTGVIDEATAQYSNIEYMACTPENGFFPDLEKVNADVIYICSPNNPTGACATREQLENAVKICKERGSILVFDAAYAPFITTPGTPKSIYEIEGADEVAIECNSFSKYAGFTGVRLGWTVVPEKLKFADGTPVRNDFNRVMSTAFNGASNIVQEGGMAILTPEGLAEIDVLIKYYLENAKILRDTMVDLGYTVFGGIDAPYIFVQLPEGKKSWDVFSEILETAEVVTIPGAGFGPGGEGFLRLSAFAPRDGILEACDRLKKTMAK